MHIYVICGHGAGDPGAVGGGYHEADIVRQIGSAIIARSSDASMYPQEKNAYKSNDWTGRVPKGAGVVELHMDSSGAASAHGAHVIISSSYEADSVDIALRDFLVGILPGRSTTISKRSNLANVNRAKSAGINYRLVEIGFISNDNDRNYVLSHIDSIADGIIEAFGQQAQNSHVEIPRLPDNAVYRLYTENGWEHLYSTSWDEVNRLVNETTEGWIYEGQAWQGAASGHPIYRVWDGQTVGWHVCDDNAEEICRLILMGWKLECILTYTPDEGIPVYHAYEEATGKHIYTTSTEEMDSLVATGKWSNHGIIFYGV